MAPRIWKHAIVASLILTAHLTSGGIFPRNDTFLNSDAKDHVEAWTKSSDCYANYFALTEDNLKASNLSLWFEDLITTRFNTNSTRNQTNGVSTWFGQNVLGQSNFDCSIPDGHCVGVLDCFRVVELVQKKWQSANRIFSIDELLDESRRVYFAQTMIDGVTRYMGIVYVSGHSNYNFFGIFR
jgi:hypothetical protein